MNISKKLNKAKWNILPADCKIVAQEQRKSLKVNLEQLFLQKHSLLDLGIIWVSLISFAVMSMIWFYDADVDWLKLYAWACHCICHLEWLNEEILCLKVMAMLGRGKHVALWWVVIEEFHWLSHSCYSMQSCLAVGGFINILATSRQTEYFLLWKYIFQILGSLCLWPMG